MSRLSMLLLLSMCALLTGSSNGYTEGPPLPQFQSQVKTMLTTCIGSGLQSGNFEKTQVGAGVVLDINCNTNAALNLYTILGQIGVPETNVTFENHDTGLTRTFGPSQCYIDNHKADGTPQAIYFCRIVLDVGDLVVNRF